MRKANGSLTRRDLLGRSAEAVVAAPLFVSAAALGREGNTAPSERITLGVIGIGPRCTYDLQAMLKQPDVQCVAVCDVQSSRREAGKRLVDEHYRTTDCAVYRDFHELLARRDIDAVLIATGDRWHAPASILAARAGKDVYSEKPCGLTIAWCQTLDDTVRQTKRVFQAGTQRRSVANFRAAVRLAHSGNSASSIRCTPPCTRRECKRLGCRLSRRRRATWWIGTGGWGRRRGGRTTRRTSKEAGAATGTSTRARGCWTGAPTPWTCASGPTGPTTPCRWSMSRRPPT